MSIYVSTQEVLNKCLLNKFLKELLLVKILGSCSFLDLSLIRLNSLQLMVAMATFLLAQQLPYA